MLHIVELLQGNLLQDSLVEPDRLHPRTGNPLDVLMFSLVKETRQQTTITLKLCSKVKGEVEFWYPVSKAVGRLVRMMML